MEHLTELLSRESIGLTLRVFAGKSEAVAKQADSTLALARKAAALEIGKPVFKHILILVAEDERRVDHDCGETANYIKKKLKAEPCRQIKVISCKTADLFCGILNLACAKLLRMGCRYMMVCSHLASDYLDLHYLNDAAAAFAKGAVAVPLAITELQQSILDGIGANTAMLWDIEALVSVGCFDQFAEQPFKKGHQGLFTDERLVGWIQGQRLDGKDALYPSAGVEEVIALIRLARMLGYPCIAPVMPSSGKVWELPTDPAQLERHQNKMATKRVRQEGMARHVNADLGVLRDAVMDGYGWKR